jgi:hypothetical protein
MKFAILSMAESTELSGEFIRLTGALALLLASSLARALDLDPGLLGPASPSPKLYRFFFGLTSRYSLVFLCRDGAPSTVP